MGSGPVREHTRSGDEPHKIVDRLRTLVLEPCCAVDIESGRKLGRAWRQDRVYD